MNVSLTACESKILSWYHETAPNCVFAVQAQKGFVISFDNTDLSIEGLVRIGKSIQTISRVPCDFLPFDTTSPPPTRAQIRKSLRQMDLCCTQGTCWAIQLCSEYKINFAFWPDSAHCFHSHLRYSPVFRVDLLDYERWEERIISRMKFLRVKLFFCPNRTKIIVDFYFKNWKLWRGFLL